MNKSDLIFKIAARHPQLVVKDVEIVVDSILNAIAMTTAKGERTEIRGFGSFGLNYRQPRMGRNPKTGERVPVPGKFVPHFKAGKELRGRVDLSPPAPSALSLKRTVT